MIRSDMNYFEWDNGDIKIWIEQETSIHVKIATKTNDPVELSEDEAFMIAKILQRFAKSI